MLTPNYDDLKKMWTPKKIGTSQIVNPTFLDHPKTGPINDVHPQKNVETQIILSPIKCYHSLLNILSFISQGLPKEKSAVPIKYMLIVLNQNN
jgi:hypothetical protein